MKRTTPQLESLLTAHFPILTGKEKARLERILSFRYQELYPHRFGVRLLPGLFASALLTLLLVIGISRVANRNTSLQSISNDLDHMVIEEESFL